MKQLHKSETPDFLTHFITHEHPQTWDDIAPIRPQLRKHILEEQNSRCAYTEIRLKETQCHIDHYRTRNLFPEQVFDFANLFVAHNAERFGAKHKDKCISRKSDYDLLVNPALENPSDFLEFTFTGEVQARGGNEKGKRTIAYFNLNDTELVERRRNAIRCLSALPETFLCKEVVTLIGEFDCMVQQLYNDRLSFCREEGG